MPSDETTICCVDALSSSKRARLISVPSGEPGRFDMAALRYL